MDFYEDAQVGSLYSLKEPLQLSEKEKVSLCDWTDQKKIEENEDFYETCPKGRLKLRNCCVRELLQRTSVNGSASALILPISILPICIRKLM